MKKIDGNTIDWDALVGRLEDWYKSLESQEGIRVAPSVTEIANENAGPEQKPWAVLASTVLSLRTKDEVSVEASRRLLGKAGTPKALLQLKQEQIEKLIYPVGFYRNKAANLLKIAAIIEEQYKGSVPDTLEALLELPGVGLKTANLTLSEGFNKDAICVDIHVHRISNRQGWVETSSPDETEAVLTKIMPRQYWKRINHLLVRYGQEICRPISPWCSKCIVRAYCRQVGVDKSR
ncbi:MAG: endonuclease III [Spirochaetaceae bacterium]|jgi:endonuclease-3|nr:endonuclease III [Spirochaetaceae bacterium]